MSDTTKINKARVNGVLYDLGGSGGGTGGVSGAWLAPGELIKSGYIDAGSESNWQYMTINSEALIDQLEKAGIDVDEDPFMNSDETNINIEIGKYFKGTLEYTPIWMDMSSSEMTMGILDGTSIIANVYPQDYSLRQVIETFFSNVTELHCDVPSSGDFSVLANYIQIHYSNAGITLRYYIPDMSDFCEKVFEEYSGGGSDSSSS